MKKHSIPIVLVSFALLFLALATAQAGGVLVTFQVKMNVKMLEGSFQPGSGDIVRVNGSFNDWGNSTDTLKDPDGDSVYSKTVSLPLVPGDTLVYKFWKTLRAGIDWEGDPNRTHIIASSNDTVAADYFDRDDIVTPPVAVPVTFQVNMRVKMLEGTFLPGSGDIVRLAGSMNDWGNSKDTMTDLDHDSVYTKTDTLLENQAVQYKFLKTLRSGLDWENGDNRQYTVPPGGGAVTPAFFDHDSVYVALVTASIVWQVDMSAYEQLGWFRPDLGDTMQIRGPFNGWGGTIMDQSFITPSQFSTVYPVDGAPASSVQYKYFMQLDSISAAERFPGYNAATRDGIAYDHPATKGDGNRSINLQNGGDLNTELAYFSDINPNGIIPAGDTVAVTITANMGPATRYIIPFDPAADTAKLIFQDALSRAAQAKIQGSFPDLTMTPASAGDTIYTATFWIIGPAHYNLQYTFRYVQPGGATVDQGGGLGGQNLFTSRFIQPLSFGKVSGLSKTATSWPSTYSAPPDAWQKDAPLGHEDPPFPIVNGVAGGRGSGKPAAYALLQNYPNPFNPSTRIVYSLPEKAHVSLKVYNLLGQEIATLVNRDEPAGNYVSLFEANRFPSGVYFYKLQAGTYLNVKKMLLVR